MKVLEKEKLSVLNVKTIEEEIILIKEAEEDYKVNGGIDARKSYIKGLEFISNFKI